MDFNVYNLFIFNLLQLPFSRVISWAFRLDRGLAFDMVAGVEVGEFINRPTLCFLTKPQNLARTCL
jgi:hypothetical protein